MDEDNEEEDDKKQEDKKEKAKAEEDFEDKFQVNALNKAQTATKKSRKADEKHLTKDMMEEAKKDLAGPGKKDDNLIAVKTDVNVKTTTKAVAETKVETKTEAKADVKAETKTVAKTEIKSTTNENN